jgi:hypothetical protein
MGHTDSNRDIDAPLFRRDLAAIAEIINAGGDVTVPPSKEEDDEGERYVCAVVWNELHWPWESGLPIPFDGGGGSAPETLARPAFFRTYVVVSGVDAKTRRVAFDQDAACPFCRDRFRNPNAMKLHIEQRHNAAASVLKLDADNKPVHEE